VDAIVPDIDLDDEQRTRWTEINHKYSLIWPVITQQKDALPDAEQYDGVPNKYEQYFSEAPGQGDRT